MSTDDFEDYRKKVGEYVETHKQHPSIKKLIYNEPITQEDYKELERIFTKSSFIAEERPNAEQIKFVHVINMFKENAIIA